MFDTYNMAGRLQNDMQKIQLDSTVDYAQIQADIIKKTGGLKNNTGANLENNQGQYQSTYIPPSAYQGQYVYNYNWQQPAVQNAYAAQQTAYNAQMAQMQPNYQQYAVPCYQQTAVMPEQMYQQTQGVVQNNGQAVAQAPVTNPIQA